MEKLLRSSLSFPVDLTREILSRLPEKSVARFRCVSKLWSSITTDPYFIDLFETRCPGPSLLIYVRKDDNNLCAYSIPQHSLKAYSSSSLPFIRRRYHFDLPGEYSNFTFTESVHGLICVQADQKPIVWIWNPTMTSFLPLPNPNNPSWKRVTLFLGYDPIKGKHKVVCIRCDKVPYECRVLTLGSPQESWRTVETDVKHRACCLTSEGRCINGVIYYKAGIYYNAGMCYSPNLALMSFGVRSEKFHMIERPPGALSLDCLLNYGGRLACTDYCLGRLWILEHAERKWSTKDFLVPSQYYEPSLETKFKAIGFTHAGEFVYLPEDMFPRSFCILFYDPVRNCCRRLKFKEIAEEESWLDRHELLVFPNYTESLKSLVRFS
ncbi:unnamed protein product [Microthlaspi erraticum]|uniref:F-box domain-containing protein n=1 Tax=Microthlaspi erraticum TaxID=1685480 RepID=A0A6D2IHN8_9BRAS|nr:unnamed protein product [Microthlaspi erraticum]CAA7047943.1 unnamed protein product [Microthlaspi erraticum]